MKKLRLFIILFLLLGLGLSSCIQNIDNLPPRGKYENGVLVINEGNFLQANGSISFYDLDSNKVSNDIFKRENGFGLAATIQNIFEYEGNIFIICNNPSKIEVVDANTFQLKATINTGLNNPFGFTAIGNRAYISNWGTLNLSTFLFENSFIAVIDLNTFTVTQTIPRNVQPQHLFAVDQNLYIADVGSNTVTVLNPTNPSLSLPISVPFGPDKMLADANNKLWVLCNSGSLVRINPTSNSVEATINNVPTAGFNEKAVMNGAGNKLYFLSPAPFPSTEVKVFAMDITATSAPTIPIITGQNFYGLGCDPRDNTIYIGDSNAFQSNGKVLRFNENGNPKDNFTVGLGPNGFWLR